MVVLLLYSSISDTSGDHDRLSFCNTVHGVVAEFLLLKVSIAGDCWWLKLMVDSATMF